jgi:VanZ family protein
MRVVLLAVCWIGLLVATHLPPSAVPKTGINDKVEHFGAYAVLSSLLVFAMRRRGIKGFLWAVAICLVYAALDEWTLIFVGRDCELLDWVADGAGAIAGTLFALTASHIAARRAAD